MKEDQRGKILKRIHCIRKNTGVVKNPKKQEKRKSKEKDVDDLI